VGHLVLADFDAVDMTNLQRQIIHNTTRVGINKAQSAAQTIKELNPDVTVTSIEKLMNEEELKIQINSSDLVLDCSDNFATRFAINKLCIAAKKPLVSGAAIRLEGQISVLDARHAQSPCYRCLYDEGNEDFSCAANGVLGPLVGVIGSLQALEAIKLIVGFGTNLVGRLLILDARHLAWREIKLAKDPQCPVCGHL
jgi:molybdopterin-synthase adenylyltransferase